MPGHTFTVSPSDSLTPSVPSASPGPLPIRKLTSASLSQLSLSLPVELLGNTSCHISDHMSSAQHCSKIAHHVHLHVRTSERIQAFEVSRVNPVGTDRVFDLVNYTNITLRNSIKTVRIANSSD